MVTQVIRDFPHISEWIHTCSRTSPLVPQGEIYTRGLRISTYNRMGSTRCSAGAQYQQLVPQGRRAYVPGKALQHVYQNGDLHRQLAATTTSSFQPQGEIYIQGHSMYIPEWIYTVPPISYYSAALCRKEKYTPRDMASPCIYQNGSTLCRHSLPPAKCWRKYNPGHGIYVYNRIPTLQKKPPISYHQQLVPQGRNTPRGHGIPPCIRSEWDLHRCRQLATQ
jgi:hypothetical protein